jgi:hypothetical protein
MNEQTLEPAVKRLIGKYGSQGAIEYISTGDYPAEIKDQAVSMIHASRISRQQHAMAVGSDSHDFASLFETDDVG